MNEKNELQFVIKPNNNKKKILNEKKEEKFSFSNNQIENENQKGKSTFRFVFFVDVEYL